MFSEAASLSQGLLSSPSRSVIPEAKQEEAWKDVLEKSEGKDVTARLVRKVVRSYRTIKPDRLDFDVCNYRQLLTHEGAVDQVLRGWSISIDDFRRVFRPASP